MDVEQHLVEDARRFAEPGPPAVTPKLAAPVLLLRPPFEVYLIRRALTMAFAADMHAFPGGRVDPRDADLDWVAPAHRLGLPDAQARAVAAAAGRGGVEGTRGLPAGRTPGDPPPRGAGPGWGAARP